MMKSVVIFLSLSLLVIAGCKKPITEPNSGIYRGTFFEIFDNGDTGGQGIAYIALSKGDGGFSLSGDTATGAPLSCYGTYVINNSTQMTFTNNAIVDYGYHPYNILDTVYYYTFNDHNFNLTLEVDTMRYEYNLIRD